MQRFSHVNATNRNSYLYIIRTKLVTKVKKTTKTKIQTFCLSFGVFKIKLKKKTKIRTFEILGFKNLKIVGLKKYFDSSTVHRTFLDLCDTPDDPRPQSSPLTGLNW